MKSIVLAHLGLVLRKTGHPDEALAALREAVDMVRVDATLHGLAFALVHLAHTELDLGNGDDVPAFLTWAGESARRVHNAALPGFGRLGAARLAFDAGDASTALAE